MNRVLRDVFRLELNVLGDIYLVLRMIYSMESTIRRKIKVKDDLLNLRLEVSLNIFFGLLTEKHPYVWVFSQDTPVNFFKHLNTHMFAPLAQTYLLRYFR